MRKIFLFAEFPPSDVGEIAPVPCDNADAGVVFARDQLGWELSPAVSNGKSGFVDQKGRFFIFTDSDEFPFLMRSFMQ